MEGGRGDGRVTDWSCWAEMSKSEGVYASR